MLFLTESAKSRGWLGLVGSVGRVGRVGRVGPENFGVAQKMSVGKCLAI